MEFKMCAPLHEAGTCYHNAQTLMMAMLRLWPSGLESGLSECSNILQHKSDGVR